MLARRLPTILPELSREESLEATQLHSVAGLLGGPRGDCSAPARSARRIIRSRRSGCSAAAAPTCDPARSASRITASCSSTSSRSSAVMPSRDCDSPSRTAASSSRGPWARWSSPRGSPSWPPPTRARAGSMGTACGDASADPTASSCTGTSCRDRCSIGSTSGLRIPRSPRTSCSAPRRGSASAVARERVEEARDRQRRRWAAAGCVVQRASPGAGRAPDTARCLPVRRRSSRSAVEMLGAHGSRARPRDQGRPHRRRPRRARTDIEAGSPGRGALLPERFRDRRSSRVPDEPAPPAPRGWPPGFGAGRRERLALLTLIAAAGPPPARPCTRRRGRMGSASRMRRVGSSRAAGQCGRSRVAAADRPRRDRARASWRLGARLVTPADPEYDDRLLDLSDPPACLFLRGKPLADGARPCRDRRLEEVLGPRTG